MNALPYPYLFIGLLVLLICISDIAGLLGLFAGIILCDRNFAYTSVSIHGVPVYITEAFLFTWILVKTIRDPTWWRAAWNALPSSVQWSWGAYLFIGAYSFFRGIGTYQSLAVLRDSAICYYSVFFFLCFSMEWTEDEFRLFAKAVVLFGLLRALLSLNLKLEFLFHTAAPFTGQPAAMAMAMAMALILLTLPAGFRLRLGATLAGILILTSNVIYLVRSSWTGLFAAFVCGVSLLYWNKHSPRFGWGLLKTVVTLGGGAFILIALLSPGTETRRTALEPLPTPLRSPSATSSKPHPLIVDTHRPPPETVLPAAPRGAPPLRSGVGTQTKPLSAGPTPAQLVSTEFFSLFRGLQSNNVQTRLWFWRDALWEISETGIFSPTLQRRDLANYVLSPKLKDESPGVVSIPLPAEGFSHRPLNIYYLKPGAEPPPHPILHRTHRLLFGIPYGKPFLPPEVVWQVISHYRYDPHNSFVALLYRTGILGLTAFFALAVSVLRFSWRSFKRASSEGVLCYAALYACLANFAVHTLTDNTLENPFKGLWYWTLLGLLLSLRLGEKQEAPGS